MATSAPANVPTTWTSQIDSKGAFQRKDAQFRNRVTADGSSGFKAEAGRYHLYVSHACPWAHRTMVVRKLKGLEDVISYDVVDHYLDKATGWSLLSKSPDTHGDSVNGFKYLREAYMKTNPEYEGAITVPVLWDKKTNVVVNNESSEIIRMFNKEFNEFAKNKELDLYPEELRSKIDSINEWVYPGINNGVYRCGFAKSQEAYDTAFKELFAALDKAEAILDKSRYLTGDKLTEADVRLWTTMLRFDPVYFGHFKTNGRHLYEYPNLFNLLLEIYQMPGVKDTVNMYHIKHHYYESHTHINPSGVVPRGGENNLEQPHNRDSKFKQ